MIKPKVSFSSILKDTSIEVAVNIVKTIYILTYLSILQTFSMSNSKLQYQMRQVCRQHDLLQNVDHVQFIGLVRGDGICSNYSKKK